MIGGDMLLSDYRFTIGSQREVFTVDSHPLPWLGAISIVFCLMCAYDSQYIDWMYSIGIVNALIACGLAIFMNCFASALFVRTWRFNFGTQYAEIWQDIFGWGKHLIRIIYFLTLIYCSLTTMQVTHDTFLAFVEPRIGSNTILTNHYFIYYFIMPLFILPFVGVKRFASFRFYFLFGNIGALLVLFTAVYFFGKNVRELGFDPEKKLKIFQNDFWGTINGYSTWSVVFWAQPFLCNVAQYLPSTKQNLIITVMIATTLICAVFNIILSLLYHFTLWGSADTNDFLTVLPSGNIVTSVGLFGSVINCFITTAGYAILAAKELIFMFNEHVSTCSMLVADLAVIFLCPLILSYYTGKGAFVIDFIGKVCFFILTSILPPVLYLRAFKMRDAWGIFALIYLIVSLVLCALIMKVTIQE